MGILKSNQPPFTAIQKVKSLGWEEAVRTAEKAGVLEFGTFGERTVAGQWGAGKPASVKPASVIGALNNNDVEYALLAILRDNARAVVEGLVIAAYVTGAEAIEVCIPAADAILEEKILDLAKEYELPCTVSVGIVNVRGTGDSIIHHFVTAASITALFEDADAYQKTIVVAVKKADGAAGRLMEIPYGRTVGEIVQATAAQLDKASVKAVSIGTHVYDSSAFDRVIDEHFQPEDGVITLYDNKCCMVDQAEKSILRFRRESCGKCTFCREGTIQIHTMLKDMTQGKGKTTDVAMIKEIGSAMRFSSMCSLGQTAAEFTLGALELFGEEMEAHIRRKKCPTETCAAFMNLYIDPVECDGCGDCLDVCPKNCIEGKPGFIHMIDEFDCNKCGKCITICPKNAVIRTTGRLPKLPERLTRVGRFR